MNIHIEKAVKTPWFFTLIKILSVVVLSRMQIIGSYPFGIAYAAVFAEENMLAAFFALTLGAASVGKTVMAKYVLIAGIYEATIYLRKIKNRQVRAVALGIAVVIASAALLFKTGVTAYSVLMIIPEVFAVGGLYRLFSNEKAEGISEYGKEMLIAGACLGGIYGLKIPYIEADLAVLAGMLIVISAGFSCGMPVAVLTGTFLGFMIFIKGPYTMEMTGVLAFSAAVSAILAKIGKVGASAGFLSGMTIGVLFLGEMGVLNAADIFAAPIIFMLLPESMAAKAGDRINRIFQGANCEKSGEQIAQRLKTVAQAVEDLGSGVKTLVKDVKGETDICEEVYDRVCKGCRNRTICFSEKEDIYKKMREIKKAIERDGFLNYSNFSGNFKISCIRPENFMSEFSHMYELNKQNEVYIGESVYDRNIAVNQYGEFSNIINGLSETVTVLPKTEEEKYKVTVAVSQEPKGGQEISGDTVIHFKNGSRYFVILCDGMGSGRAAREISSLTARLFAEFFNSGIEKKSAVNMINSALALNADRESFSSADILEIDLVTGVAEFLKIGSAQSFIKRGEDIEEISSSALPIGILENIEVTPQRYILSDKDMLLMVSDGVGEASSGVMKNDWIKKLFRTAGLSDEELANRFLEGARSRTVYSDDLTSVIVRIRRRDVK